jgi:gamma-glutamyltranspeptidase/glutathione hydrolase
VLLLLVLFVPLTVAFSAGDAAAAATPGDLWKASGKEAVVAAGGAEAADAAIATLQSGGNAADAAVAALLVLSVTDPKNFCFGGEVPVLVYDARRKLVEVVCGQGVAPRLATVEYFRQHNGGHIPAGGDPTTATVPGAPDAMLTLLDRYGTKTFAESARAMLALLDRGKEPWHPQLARQVRRMIEAERGSPGDRRRGLRLAADCFYRGPIARDLDAWSRAQNAPLRYTDLATHCTRIEDPIAVDYRGYTVLKCGPWTQGPCLLETLRLLEKFDLKGMGHNRPGYVHVVVEAMKLALADRDTYYGDALFVDVPLAGLLSAQYAELRRPLIDVQRASLELRPGDPRGGRALLGIEPQDYRLPPGPVRDTTTCLVADRQGSVVAATPSGWDGVLAGSTGIIVNSRLRSLNTWPGHPNCLEPGKRPRITLTPTMILKDGKPVAAISVAGGDLQDQVSLQVLLSWLEFGQGPAEAVTAPRFATDHLVGSFNQTPPQLGSLTAYAALGEETIAALRKLGHRVTIGKPPLGHPVMLTIDPQTGQKRAAGDPAAGRHARGY